MARPPVPSGFDCYHCGSDLTCRAGFGKHKKQRFYCRACRRWFLEGVESKNSGNKRKVKGELPSKEYLIAELKEVAKELGRVPVTNDWPALREQERVYPIYVYYTVFDSFLEALKQAKLKPRYKQEFDDADRRRMLNELRELQRKLGRTLFDDDVDEARRRNEVSPPYHFARAFGSVPLAIEAAGAAKKIYTRDEMIAYLRKMSAKLGKPIEFREITKNFRSGKGPSIKAIIKEFGTLTEARLAAGIPLTDKNK